MINLSIVILSFNTRDLTLKCIRSLVDQYKLELESNKFEIIVVDNDSKDDSVEYIKKEFSSKNFILLVENKINTGFSKGCNIGAKSSRGEYVLFLNSDTIVLDRGLVKMLEFLEKNEKIGILGGKLLNPNGSPQASSGKFYTLSNLFLMLIGAERLGFLRESPEEIKKVDWVSGACMLSKKEVFDKIGGFDEKLFMYMEDMEMCFRAKKNGFFTYFYPYIQLKHKELGSGNREFAVVNIYKGILYFYSKHRKYWEYIFAKILLDMKAFVLIFAGIATFNRSLVSTYRKAINI